MTFLAVDQLCAARLQSLVGASGTRASVGLAADIEEVERVLDRVPAVFCTPLAERPLRLDLDDEYVRHDLVWCRVVIAVSNIGKDQGRAGLTVMRNFVESALVGWVPADGTEPLFWAGGDLLQINGTQLWWFDDYVMRRTVNMEV